MDSETGSSLQFTGLNSYSQPPPALSSGWIGLPSQSGPRLWSVPPPNWTGNNYFIPQLPVERDVVSSSEMLGAQTVTNAIANRYYAYNNINSSSSYGYREQVPHQGGGYGEGISLARYRSEVEGQEKQTRREQDQEWVDAFVANVVKASSVDKTRNGLSIRNARILIKKCIGLIGELKAIHTKLNTVDKSDDALWNSTAAEAVDVKTRLESAMYEMTSNHKMTDLGKKVKRIRKKRERLKRQKHFMSEEKKEKEKRNKLQHEKLDFWLQSIRQDYLNSEMEKKMKKEADSILSEVRRKKAEANRTMDLVKSLSKLRSVRKQMAEAKGLYSSSESDVNFTKSIAHFETILTNRLTEYGEEERALQVILEEEQQETRDMETKRQQEERDSKENTLRAEVLRSLFGLEASISEHDPRFRCYEYLTRSERDLDTLIHVRNTWDSWLSRNKDGQSDNSSSTVPIGWIQPSNPTNERWASMVNHQ